MDEDRAYEVADEILSERLELAPSRTALRAALAYAYARGNRDGYEEAAQAGMEAFEAAVADLKAQAGL